MPKYDIECSYCGHRWEEVVWSFDDKECRKCNDKNLRARELENKDVYGYNSDKPKTDAYIRNK